MPSDELSTGNASILKYDTLNDTQRRAVHSAYGDGDEGRKEWEHAYAYMSQVGRDLELREQGSDVFNGIPYSQAYEYNRRKAINYSPPRTPGDDREISMGLVHEKVVTFCAIFLKYVWKRRVTTRDSQGRLVKGLGDLFDLAIEYSHQLECFVRKMVLILWEVMTQGNAFVLEDWQVRLIPMKTAYRKDKATSEWVKVDPDKMDYTYEFLEGLRYEDADPVQERKANSVVLDGRNVIFADPEVEEAQDQERLTIEIAFPRVLAEQLFGSLERWKSVPKDMVELTALLGENNTLFDSKRFKKPEDTVIAHLAFEKFANRHNIYLNGVMMLPRETMMSLFYPRRNYPLTNVSGERLKGSIYSRSIPAKTKFNADFMDWAMKGLAEAFEQGLFPALLSHGKYTLTRDMFRAGQVTHGVRKEDYEFANPDRAKGGITQSEFSFVELLKQIFEGQTASGSASGEVDAQATATAISTAEANQMDKLGYLLDGLIVGMMDLAQRRIETIESKYTSIEKKTLVDGKEVDVYSNFTVTANGYENNVMMDERIGTPEFEPEKQKTQDALFNASFREQKAGTPSRYILGNPKFIRGREYTTYVEIVPELRKQTNLQMIQFWDEVRNLKELFPNVNDETLQEEYLKVSGRPEDMFRSADMVKLEQEKAAMAAAGGQPGAQPDPSAGKYNTGSFGKPTVKPKPAANAARTR